MKNQIVKKITRALLVGSLLTGMIYASSTLATRHVSAATCDCSSLLSAAAADCRLRFGNPGVYPLDCSESAGELILLYRCTGDPEFLTEEQSCQL